MKSDNLPAKAEVTPNKISNLKTKTLNLATRATKKTLLLTKTASRKFANFQIPASITWVYSLGFKIGILLILKSFLILRYQARNLSASGITLITAQFFMAIIMIVGGVTMQTQSMYEDPHKLRRAASKYGFITLICVGVIILKEWMRWSFFKIPTASNWFMNIWTTITKGAGEITLSILFWDFELWTLFCGLLYIIADVYLYEIFDDSDSLWGKIIRTPRKRLALPAKANEQPPKQS